MITVETPRVSYVGDGIEDDFTFAFTVFETTDLLVYVDSVLKTLNVHYTVVLNGGGVGGTVTFGASYIPAAAAVVYIIRSIPLSQSADFVEGDALPAETLESALDKMVMLIQDMNSKLGLLASPIPAGAHAVTHQLGGGDQISLTGLTGVPDYERIVQVVNTQSGAVATGTTLMVLDDTIPQITEGIEFMTLAITPKNASNKLRIEVTAFLSHNVPATIIGALFVGATLNALGAVSQYMATAQGTIILRLAHYMTAGAITPLTFRFRAGGNAPGTTTLNGASSARFYGGVAASSITITEIAA